MSSLNGVPPMLPAVAEFVSRPHDLIIDGERMAPLTGGVIESVDPATGQVVGRVAEGGAEDVDRAVTAAHRAFRGGWSRFSAQQRERVILKLADLVESHATELAQLDSLDSGKPAAQVEAIDLSLAVGHFRYYGGWPTKITGSTVPVDGPDMHVYTRREPVGVVGAIVPWNFPLCQAAFKVAPALAAGCTVVLKPSELTPLSALRLGELALEAGIPPGVLNVVPGYGVTAGRALVDHPLVDKIAFTGSEIVGKQIARRGADTLKHVSLELGGKNPNIIFSDADLEAAARTAAVAAFFYTGQVCAAGSRLMVANDVHDEVVSIVVDEAKALTLGHGLDPGTTLGPLVSQEQRSRVHRYVDGAADEGANIVYGGGLTSGPSGAGFFHEPTVISDVPDQMTVVGEEIFGPVIVTQRFDSIADLVERANGTRFGLSAGVWTRDISTAHQAAALVEAGTVWVNTYSNFDATAPWGGRKMSGYGRDGGEEGIGKFLHTKTVWANIAGIRLHLRKLMRVGRLRQQGFVPEIHVNSDLDGADRRKDTHMTVYKSEKLGLIHADNLGDEVEPSRRNGDVGDLPGTGERLRRVGQPRARRRPDGQPCHRPESKAEGVDDAHHPERARLREPLDVLAHHRLGHTQSARDQLVRHAPVGGEQPGQVTVEIGEPRRPHTGRRVDVLAACRGELRLLVIKAQVRETLHRHNAGDPPYPLLDERLHGGQVTGDGLDIDRVPARGDHDVVHIVNRGELGRQIIQLRVRRHMQAKQRGEMITKCRGVGHRRERNHAGVEKFLNLSANRLLGGSYFPCDVREGSPAIFLEGLDDPALGFGQDLLTRMVPPRRLLLLSRSRLTGWHAPTLPRQDLRPLHQHRSRGGSRLSGGNDANWTSPGG
jgi:phenylacetaldehyde dehydrogenase